MEERNARDEAVKVGAEELGGLLADENTAMAVLDAVHKAGLISYRDEWEPVREALALLHSMVQAGEKMTPRSEEVLNKAMAFVRRPVEE